jgi:chemotaxis protein MotB
MAAKPKCKKCPEGTPDWLVTYGDMTTLLLTFFIMMFNVSEIDPTQMRIVLAAFQGLGMLQGGNTLQAGKLAELGNTIMALPSLDKGKALDRARKRAISEFQPEIAAKKVRIKEDERGLVISLAADAFFRPAQAELDMENARNMLIKVSDLLTSRDLADKKIRIEGHSDSTPTDPAGPWKSNWELSSARALNVLHRLVEYGVNEKQFQVAGFSDTVPLASEDTPEGRTYNRRIDIVILTEGHL